MEPEERPPRKGGRPPGREWSYKTSVYLRDEEAALLEHLAKKLQRSRNWVIGEGIRELAKRERVE